MKASTETNAQVGDKANDALRVNGKDLRAKIVGEGGNLGFTQLGRIEAALNGVILNTDEAGARKRTTFCLCEKSR